MKHKNVFIFHLWRFDENHVNLYEAIKTGKKTSEFRDFTHHWIIRLCEHASWKEGIPQRQDLTEYLKIHRIWFVVGFPKGNLPRLEADVTALVSTPHEMQLEIKFANVKEVTSNSVDDEEYEEPTERELKEAAEVSPWSLESEEQ